jgi:hypothetical protein
MRKHGERHEKMRGHEGLFVQSWYQIRDDQRSGDEKGAL